jgi:hypothetical protein
LASSNRKRRPVRVFLAAVFVRVLYFVLFPYPLHKEMVAHPALVATIPESAPSVPGSLPAVAAPFHLGESFGYVSGDGTVLYAGRRLFRVSLGEAGFVNYTRLGTDWLLQGPTGRRIASFSGNGYPLLSPDGSRIFNVKSDLSGMIELNSSGETLWDRDFPALMTSVSINEDSALVGLMDGTLLLLNRHGSPMFSRSLKGSRIGVVMGAALSADGSKLAAVSGIDPQVLTLFRRRDASFEQVAVKRLSSDFRREVRMAFSPDSRFLAFEDAAGVGFLDPSTASVETFELAGQLSGIAFPGHGRSAAFIGRSGATARLEIVAPFSEPIYSEKLSASDVFLGSVDGQLLLGWDGRLMRIDIEAL